MATVQWLIEHVWLAPVPPAVWFLQRTRTARTIATVIRGEIRDQGTTTPRWPGVLSLEGYAKPQLLLARGLARDRCSESWRHAG